MKPPIIIGALVVLAATNAVTVNRVLDLEKRLGSVDAVTHAELAQVRDTAESAMQKAKQAEDTAEDQQPTIYKDTFTRQSLTVAQARRRGFLAGGPMTLAP
jgi:hypothetical protein